MIHPIRSLFESLKPWTNFSRNDKEIWQAWQSAFSQGQSSSFKKILSFPPRKFFLSLYSTTSHIKVDLKEAPRESPQYVVGSTPTSESSTKTSSSTFDAQNGISSFFAKLILNIKTTANLIRIQLRNVSSS